MAKKIGGFVHGAAKGGMKAGKKGLIHTPSNAGALGRKGK